MFKNTKITAFGLVESLLAMAIFGTAFIVATSITIKSLRIVKNNELADFANSIMVRSLEYTKSDEITSGFIGNNYGYYRVTGNVPDLNVPIALTYQNNSPSSLLTTSNCTATSPYRINMSADPVLNNFLVCNQIIINSTANGNYQLVSRMVYKLDNEFILSEVKGFKPS